MARRGWTRLRRAPPHVGGWLVPPLLQSTLLSPLPFPPAASTPAPLHRGGQHRSCHSFEQQSQWHMSSNHCLHGCASKQLRFLFQFCNNSWNIFLTCNSIQCLQVFSLSATDDGATIQFHKSHCADSLLGENVIQCLAFRKKPHHRDSGRRKEVYSRVDCWLLKFFLKNSCDNRK